MSSTAWKRWWPQIISSDPGLPILRSAGSILAPRRELRPMFRTSRLQTPNATASLARAWCVQGHLAHPRLIVIHRMPRWVSLLSCRSLPVLRELADRAGGRFLLADGLDHT